MLKNVLLLCSLSLFLAINGGAQDAHSFQWRYQSSFGANLILLDALPLDDRGYACGGLVESPVGSAVYYPCLFRLDCKGAVKWARLYNQPTESANNTGGRVLQISATDFVLVANVGFFFSTPYNDIFLARVDGAGNTVWTRRIGGGTGNQDLARAAIVTSDGNIVLAGQTGSWGTDANTNNTYTDQYFMKLGADGNILWTRTVGNPQKVDRAYDIVEMPDQSLVAAGSYIHTGGTFYGNVLKLDKNGVLLWNKAFGEGTTPHANHFYGILRTSDGGLLLTGSSTNLQNNFQGYPDFLIVKTDANGNRQWSRVVSGGSPDLFESASGAVEKPNGDFAVMCATNSYPTVGFVGNKYAVLTLSPAGNKVQVRTFNAGSSHYPRIRPHQQEGGYLISGFTNWTSYGGNGNRFDPLLINLDENFNAGCFQNDYTAFTTLYDPAFDVADVPGVANTGGAILNAIVEASDITLLQNVACEANAYESCSPFTSVDDLTHGLQSLELYPNPVRADQSFYLRWEGAGIEIVQVFDVHGRFIREYAPAPGMDNLELRLESAGFYWVCLKGRGTLKTIKIMVAD